MMKLVESLGVKVGFFLCCRFDICIETLWADLLGLYPLASDQLRRYVRVPATVDVRAPILLIPDYLP